MEDLATFDMLRIVEMILLVILPHHHEHLLAHCLVAHVRSRLSKGGDTAISKVWIHVLSALMQYVALVLLLLAILVLHARSVVLDLEGRLCVR